VSVSDLIPDSQWFNTLIARPLTRWRHIPNDIIPILFCRLLAVTRETKVALSNCAVPKK